MFIRKLFANLGRKAGKENLGPMICGKCGIAFSENDKFCRRCGTKRGNGDFERKENIMQILYGPPPGEKNSRYFGIKRARKEFNPANNIMEELYGPPPIRGVGDFNPTDNIMDTVYGSPSLYDPHLQEYTFVCSNCEHKWTENKKTIDSIQACPSCGCVQSTKK
jgi:ribosomal protein L40E